MSPLPTPHEPILLNGARAKAGAYLLARAFQDDPLMVYMLPNAQRRKRLLPVLFGVVVRYCLRYGVIYTTSGLEGVICCLPPGQITTIGRLALISLSDPPLQLGLIALRRFLRASAASDRAHKQAAPGTHWYIWALGVDPACQGQGFGGQLVRTVLWQAKARGKPCYLDTENPRNVPFYGQFGFRQVSESPIIGSDVRVYAMLWEPDEV
jgi:ribosomal protein S18 acetylase RimI-like enzyme